MLVYGLPGTAKTLWASTATNPGWAACETGHGSGLLTVAEKGIDYVEPSTFDDFQAFCNGAVFKEKDTLVLDSLSYMAKSFIKDYALKMPRKFGDSPKRKAGVPELDDYGVMGALIAQLLERLFKLDKHIVVLATEKINEADPENGKNQTIIGPDLPGAMFTGAPAMFDTVLRLRTRPKLRDPKDSKSRYTERYFVTETDGVTIAKCRSVNNGKSLLAPEEVFDPNTGQGSFPDLLHKILAGYKVQANG